MPSHSAEVWTETRDYQEVLRDMNDETNAARRSLNQKAYKQRTAGVGEAEEAAKSE